MFSALKKLAKGGEERCPAPTPMSSSLQKKFSRGVHYNMKILIKGDRNVGKSCLLQRLQGGPFIEEYIPTDQIQVAPIHWTYKNTDHIVKVEVWEVVDKGKQKKKPPLGLKLENQVQTSQDDDHDSPVLDATFLDVYKNASGVILVMDITKTWTFDYVTKELNKVPADLPVVVLGNHCDMQHHRQVHPHHIDQLIHQAKLSRTAPIRYAESSMRNGFGLRFLHKFLSVPFLKLQRTSLLEQLQRNQKDTEEIEQDLDEFQKSDETQYNCFVDRLANKRRQSNDKEQHVASDHSPSIVLGAGKPIIPSNVNPLMAQSLNPLGIKAQYAPVQKQQTQYVSSDLVRPRSQVKKENATSQMNTGESIENVSSNSNIPSTASYNLDNFYAGALDNSFLEDATPLSNNNQDPSYDSESDDDKINPLVLNEEDDLEIPQKPQYVYRDYDEKNVNWFSDDEYSLQLWTHQSSVRRSPEGGEDPDVSNEGPEKKEKKQKKKKPKDKDKADAKSEKQERKHKKKIKNEKKVPNPQHGLLAPEPNNVHNDDYDSI